MLEMLDGATRLYPIIGDPIAQVKSPAGVTRALLGRGRNAITVPVHASPADLAAVVDALARIQNVDGIIVTVPHKFACHALCTSVAPRSDVLGVVNVMRRRRDGGWHGDMFDGVGFAQAQIAGGATLSGARALLVGAGGAGSAIALGLLEAGVGTLVVHDRDAARVAALIARLSANENISAGAAHGNISAGAADPAGFDIVCNASTAGMREGDPLPVPIARLRREMFVGEVITAPAVTPLLAAARAIGCRTQTGSGMYAAVETLMIDFFAENWT